MKNQELWNRLLQFDFDDPAASLSLTDRLARENNWDKQYAHQVICEYRRFLYLSQAAGHPVTPSDEVDQAWHLHMVYTRSYWHELCRDTLGRELHHGPTKGGRAEQDKFRDWYARTLQSYQQEFGAHPPTTVWPDPEKRFHGDFRRINLAQTWVLSKKTTWLSTGIIATSLAFASCRSQLDSSELGILIFLAFPALIGLAYGLSTWRTSRPPRPKQKGKDKSSRRGKNRGGWGRGGGCSSYSGGSHGDNDSGGGGGGGGCGGGGCGGGCGD